MLVGLGGVVRELLGCVKIFCYLFYCLLFGIGCDIFYVCGDIGFSCIISLLFLFGGIRHL